MVATTLPTKALAQVASVTNGAIRVGPLLGIPPLLSELGLDPGAVILEAGVDPGVFDDPENFISFAAMGRLLAHCATRTGCPHFGLLAGQRMGLDALGLVGMLSEHSPDVGSALNNVVLHLHLHDRGAVPTLTVDGEQALFGYAIYQPGPEGTRQIYDGAIAIAFNVIRALCGGSWRPAEVLFSHSRPADTRPFRRFFQAHLRFDAERTAIVFSAACLSLPLRGAEPELRLLLEKRIAQLVSMGAGDIVEQVRRVLRNLLLGGRGSLGQVAQIFAIHRRTLNRRLRERGLTFHELVEEVRYDIARQLLRETDLMVVEIATVLDYGDASTFTRAFRRWSATSPAAWRAAARRDRA